MYKPFWPLLATSQLSITRKELMPCYSLAQGRTGCRYLRIFETWRNHGILGSELMNKKVLILMLGLTGISATANSAFAATVGVGVTVQSVDDNGNVIGAAGTKVWDLSDAALWTATTTDGHVLNDLISSDLRWKNSGQWGSSAEFYITDLKFDADPTLSFDFTLSNNTVFNQVYSINYNTPLSPALSGNINSSANLTAILKDLGGAAGAKITPANGNGNIMRSWDITENQNQISKNVDIGNAFAITSGTGNQNWSATNTLYCSAADVCEVMSTVLTLTLSKGDSVRLYGDVTQVSEVPVPAAAWLFASGLGLLTGARRKARKA